MGRRCLSFDMGHDRLTPYLAVLPKLHHDSQFIGDLAVLWISNNNMLYI